MFRFMVVANVRQHNVALYVPIFNALFEWRGASTECYSNKPTIQMIHSMSVICLLCQIRSTSMGNKKNEMIWIEMWYQQYNCSSFENKSHKTRHIPNGYSTRVCRTHHVAMQTSNLSILLPIHPIPMLYIVSALYQLPIKNWEKNIMTIIIKQ